MSLKLASETQRTMSSDSICNFINWTDDVGLQLYIFTEGELQKPAHANTVHKSKKLQSSIPSQTPNTQNFHSDKLIKVSVI